MVETITPVVHGGRAGRWAGSVALHVTGAVASAAAFGAILGAAGSLLGGVLADRLSSRDARWYAWLSGAVSLAAAPFFAAFAQARSAGLALACFGVFYFLNNIYVPSLWTLVQSLVHPRLRALSSATQLAVTNVFGERIWVEPASARDESWRSWGMFTTTDRGGGTAPGLVLLTTTPTIMQGRPTEGVQFVRDEVANLVWAVETTVPLPDGSSRRGREAATELHRRYQDALDGTPPATPPDPPNDAAIRYRLMTGVGENWIPFVPVHIPGDTREIQLRRASMPRLLTGAAGTPEKIRPRTVVLRPGTDDAVPPLYDVYEEEISRAGEVVTCSWQRTRWTGGRVCTWLGLERRPGRGEASSGLAFDRAVPRS